MILADWIAIALLIVFAVLGIISGFSGGIRRLTKGIPGIIISIVVCYFFLGVVLSWGFVQELMSKLSEAIAGDSTGGIRVWLSESQFVGKVICAVILFIVVQVLRVVLVKIFSSIMESDNVVISAINKIFGAVLSLCVFVVLALLAAHIVTWIGGDTEASVIEYLSGSALGLDKLFLNNPLSYIINGQA